MPPPLRACVHEFGFAIVHACLSNGVSNPAAIRHLVNEIWIGARQPAQREGLQPKDANGTSGSKVLAHLDWLLIQAGAQIGARTLLRLLWQHDMAVVPREPTPMMVEASMAATDYMGVVSKAAKHRGRLRAAIAEGVRRAWPHLADGERNQKSAPARGEARTGAPCRLLLPKEPPLDRIASIRRTT